MARNSRRGRDTRAEAQKIACDLFNQKGYEATSMREIAEQLGVTKAALYYHFTSKDEIVQSVLDERLEEVETLLAWARAQPRTPHLLRDTVLRWLDSRSDNKLRGVRFAHANQATLQAKFSPARSLGGRLRELVEVVLGPGAPPAARIRAHLAMGSINAVIAATAGLDVTDAELFASARELALSLTEPGLPIREPAPTSRGRRSGARPS